MKACGCPRFDLEGEGAEGLRGNSRPKLARIPAHKIAPFFCEHSARLLKGNERYLLLDTC
jgi:hypothetical protein